MMKNDHHFQSLSICQKLFNFIINTLMAKGLKHVTFGRGPITQASAQSPSDQPITTRTKPNGISPGDSDYTIQVEFKQNDDLEYWTPLQSPTDPNILTTQQPKMKAQQIYVKAGEEITPILAAPAQTAGPRKIATIKAQPEEEKSKKNKGKNVVSEKLPLETEGEAKRKRTAASSGRHLKLFDVVSNINEKSDAFIRRRREALKRHASMENRTSS